jgi:DNA-directed RNA polymerase specialized sigma24 family protein
MSEHSGPADFSHWLDQAHRQKICHHLRHKYVSLSEADIEDVWSETQKALFEKWPSENTFSSEHSFEGLLFTIADRRATDLVRRAEARGRILKRCYDKAKAEGSDGQAGARTAHERLEYEELHGYVIEAFDQLDNDQWLVLSVYCDEYPRLKGPTRLLKTLTDQFPEVVEKGWTPAIVHRLLNHARAIVRKHLCEKGYHRDFE